MTARLSLFFSCDKDKQIFHYFLLCIYTICSKSVLSLQHGCSRPLMVKSSEVVVRAANLCREAVDRVSVPLSCEIFLLPVFLPVSTPSRMRINGDIMNRKYFILDYIQHIVDSYRYFYIIFLKLSFNNNKMQ